MSYIENNICEHCEKDCETLYTRQGFIQTFFVHWVCYDCYTKLEGMAPEEYTEEYHYSVRNV